MAQNDWDAPQKNEEKYTLKMLLGDIMDIIEAVVVSVFTMLLVTTYLLCSVNVDGSSMNPTLYNEDKLFMWSLGYTPKTGDIVIIQDDEAGHFADAGQVEVTRTQGAGICLVKRVIAVPGQTLDIDFKTGSVKRDGELLNEPYIAAPTKDDGHAFIYPITIPEGYVFVMGDNRMNSKDSRSPEVALVPVEQILGHAVLRYDRNDQLCESWKDRFAILND